MLASAPARTDTPVSTAAASCRHCGDACDVGAISTAAGTFCCRGCAAVFDLIDAHGLRSVDAAGAPSGVSQKSTADRDPDRFAVLDDPAVAARFVDFDDGVRTHVTFAIPAIHCASCVWLLEQLWRFEPGVLRSEVDLLRRSVRIEFRRPVTSLRAVAERLATLGYEPQVGAERTAGRMPSARRRLYLQLGVAGFAFGNVMIFSLPRYLNGGPLDGGFDRLFGALNIALAIPVLLFSASDYFRGSWQAVRCRRVTLDMAVALGLAALFLRSVFDIARGGGEGFLDSFSGLVFFLLIGRLFQQKAFDAIAFDRTFRSFFPLSVRVDRNDHVETVALERLRIGDTILVRPREIVPADAELLETAGDLDYAFLTGEQTPVTVRPGQIVRAGGRPAERTLRLRVTREVSHSELARLWNNPVFGVTKTGVLTDISARFGAWFLALAIALSAAGAIAWWPNAALSASVATAVLIIACPCALTLAAPITIGTAMGLLGRSGLYLKHAGVVLDLSEIDTVVFDKTGTLTSSSGRLIAEQHGLNPRAWQLVRRLAGESVHPVSRAIAAQGPSTGHVDQAREVPGQGLTGLVNGRRVAVGSAAFVAREIGTPVSVEPGGTHVGIAPGLRGFVRFTAQPREGAEAAARSLAATHDLYLTSGDHAGDAGQWRPFFGARMRFGQSPEDKLALVRQVQAAGCHVLMVGDGLNDAGALAAADVGVAVSDESACVVPSCDAVIAGARLAHLPAFLRYSKRARQVIWLCFALSIAYNVVGISFALGGLLTPLVSAILMPVSSLTIVGVSAGAMRWSARRMLPS